MYIVLVLEEFNFFGSQRWRCLRKLFFCFKLLGTRFSCTIPKGLLEGTLSRKKKHPFKTLGFILWAHLTDIFGHGFYHSTKLLHPTPCVCCLFSANSTVSRPTLWAETGMSRPPLVRGLDCFNFNWCCVLPCLDQCNDSGKRWQVSSWFWSVRNGWRRKWPVEF